jgi:hypothetical protein
MPSHHAGNPSKIVVRGDLPEAMLFHERSDPRSLVDAHLDQYTPSRSSSRLWDQGAIHPQTIRAAVEGELRLPRGDLRLALREIRTGNVRGIAHDPVDGAVRRDGSEQGSTKDGDALPEVQPCDVGSRARERFLGHICSEDAHLGPCGGNGEAYRSRATPDVGDVAGGVIFLWDAGQHGFDKGLGVGAGNEYARRDDEVQAVKAHAPHDPPEGLTLATPSDQAAESGQLFFGERTVVLKVDLQARNGQGMRQELLGLEARLRDSPATEIALRSREDLDQLDHPSLRCSGGLTPLLAP